MAQSQAEAQQRIEELNNRLFILEDRVDTSRVALESSGKAPQLPVIRLRPPPGNSEEPGAQPGSSEEPAAAPVEGEARAAEEPAPAAPRAEARSLVEDKEVRYSGRARAEGGPRPVLRLYGESTLPTPDVAAPLPGPEPAQVKERLEVVPLPSRRVARRTASAVGAVRHEYQSALDMYRSGKHAAAAEAFRTFLKRYSRHEYADNALYWLGECFYDSKSYRLALTMFRRVVEEFPKGNKAPDALLKMGYSYLKLKENENAKTVLAQLVESFPKSQVARLASETLVKVR